MTSHPTNDKTLQLTRRSLLSGSAATLAALTTQRAWGLRRSDGILNFANGKPVPKIGMGTWLTFDVAENGADYQSRKQVLETFVRLGGGMIDSSPMYGRSEQVVGSLWKSIGAPDTVFSATKIWTAMASRGGAQLEQSHSLWQQDTLDLVHVHNLLRWKAHLNTLQAAKESGHVRFVGLTTSHGRRHDDLEQLMRSESIDCVQFSYNILNRTAENSLLPTAMEHDLAVVINRPFQTGALFNHVRNRALPEWAAEIECTTWAEFFLKFVISHPGVTCAIPATRQVAHMIENMRAGTGRLPDENMRKKMIRFVENM